MEGGEVCAPHIHGACLGKPGGSSLGAKGSSAGRARYG